MNTAYYTFDYDASRLTAFHYSFSLENMIVPIIIAIIIAAYIIAYLVAPYLYGYVMAIRSARDKQDKRRVIQDLILMKEIQGELEREMEQALLSAALTDRSGYAA